MSRTLKMLQASAVNQKINQKHFTNKIDLIFDFDTSKPSIDLGEYMLPRYSSDISI